MKKALIIQLARFGDLVQTKRLAHTLCRDVETHICLDASLEDLARIVFPPEAGFVLHPVAAHGQFGPGEALARNARAFKHLASLKFDCVYNCNTSAMNAALASLFAPETVRGLRSRNGQAMRETWMQMAFRWTGERRIAPINLADYWAWFAPNPIAPDKVNPPARPGGKGLGVVLAGRMARRSLPPAVLAPIVRVLSTTLPGHSGGAPVYLLGSASERKLARELARELPSETAGRLHDLTGTTDWSGLAQSLAGLDALVSPDTGTMHLAAHLGVPVIAFFLSSAWAWETGPYGLGHRVYQAVSPCLPCVETQPCPHQAACLAPFADPSFLRMLARGGNGENLPGILRLDSAFDGLGLRWNAAPEDAENAGSDSHAATREHLRGLVWEYLNAGADPFVSVRASAGQGDSARLLFEERDWMLPPLPGTCRKEIL